MMDWQEFSFVRPAAFWALLFVPLFIALFFAWERKRRAALEHFVAPRLQPQLAGTVSPVKRRLAFFLFLSGYVLAIVALAQPRWGFRWEERISKGRDIIVAIDTSRSMLAQDLKPNRLARAKLAAQDLLDSLDGDRVGLVAFAGTAFLQAPLTADYGAIRDSLAELDTEIIPRGGTNLKAAIETATDAFGKGESEQRALIIFTDGEELEEDAVDAANEAASKFRIFTVGMGSKEGALIPFTNERGGTEYVRDENGQFVTSRLDEGRLREIAEAARGFYVLLQSGPLEMQQIVQEGLGRMKESQSDSHFTKQPIERYQWPLTGAVASFIAGLLLGERRRLRRPVTALAASVLILSAAPLYAVPQESYNRGVEAYRAGDYPAAAKAFSDALGAAPESLQPLAAYNLANALARRGATLEKKEEKLSEWKNALQHYDRTLALVPNHTDAKHNRELVQKAIEALEKPPEDQQKNKEKKDQQNDQKQENQQGQGGGSKDQQQQQQSDQKQDSQDQKQGSQQKENGNEKKQEGESGSKKEEDRDKTGGEQKQQDGQGADSQPPPAQPQRPGEGQQSPEQKPENQNAKDPKTDGKQKPPDPAKEAPKTGELKAANASENKEGQDPAKEAAEAAAAAAEGRMTPKDAKLLLEAMKKFDERVRLLDPRESQRERFRRDFKDW